MAVVNIGPNEVSLLQSEQKFKVGPSNSCTCNWNYMHRVLLLNVQDKNGTLHSTAV